jgi:hypothetical protein
MPLLAQIFPWRQAPTTVTAMGVTVIHSGRQQHQHKEHQRRRRRYLSATAFWKSGVPLVLLHSIIHSWTDWIETFKKELRYFA